MSLGARLVHALCAVAVVVSLSSRSLGQELVGPPAPGEEPPARSVSPPLEPSLLPEAGAGLNPLRVLESVGDALPGQGEPSPPATGDAPETTGLSAALNIMLVLTVLTLAPSIILMTTSFVRVLVVLGLLKQAMGTQTLPPAQVVTGLALFMTLFVMTPTIDRVWEEAVVPHRRGEIETYDELWARARQPVRDFMFDQIEATGNWSSLYMVLEHRGVDVSEPEELTRADVDMVSLIPAFMLSELKVAFVMGFRVYLPFLVIDMVIASMLISMSMMMLPPVLISLPFKLLLFVLVDGWTLVVGSLLESFVQPGELEEIRGGGGSAAASVVAPWAEPTIRSATQLAHASTWFG